MTDTSSDSTLVVVPCTDLDAAIALYTQQRGFRLDMIMPADAPRIALVSRDGVMLRLDASDAADPSIAPQQAAHGFQITRANSADAWNVGRAGMQYRDLIPGRLDGRFIASHIRIPDGGQVPDYVHYHHVRLQLIYCRRGWIRVVYEDQGEPFTMHAGDCVLQPPTIRHRVLEASPGLEVIEIGCPAEHETWRDHAITLPPRNCARNAASVANALYGTSLRKPIGNRRAMLASHTAIRASATPPTASHACA